VSHLVSSGLRLIIVGKLLGQTQASTTQRYAYLADEPLIHTTSLFGNTVQEETAKASSPFISCTWIFVRGKFQEILIHRKYRSHTCKDHNTIIGSTKLIRELSVKDLPQYRRFPALLTAIKNWQMMNASGAADRGSGFIKSSQGSLVFALEKFCLRLFLPRGFGFFFLYFSDFFLFWKIFQLR
jgi:hypothetical protein